MWNGGKLGHGERQGGREEKGGMRLVGELGVSIYYLFFLEASFQLAFVFSHGEPDPGEPSTLFSLWVV